MGNALTESVGDVAGDEIACVNGSVNEIVIFRTPLAPPSQPRDRFRSAPATTPNARVGPSSSVSQPTPIFRPTPAQQAGLLLPHDVKPEFISVAAAEATEP